MPSLVGSEMCIRDRFCRKDPSMNHGWWTWLLVATIACVAVLGTHLALVYFVPPISLPQSTSTASRRRSCAAFLLAMFGAGLCAYSFITFSLKARAWEPVSRGSRPYSSPWYQRSYYDLNRRCPTWSPLHDDEETYHTRAGGLRNEDLGAALNHPCLLYTSPSPRD